MPQPHPKEFRDDAVCADAQIGPTELHSGGSGG